MTTRQPHAFARTDRSRLGLWWWTTDHLLLGAAEQAEDSTKMFQAEFVKDCYFYRLVSGVVGLKS